MTINTQEFLLSSEAELSGVVDWILPRLKPGNLIFLEGDLGAGKTTFARFFLKALGFLGAVKSPTFSLVEPYDLKASQGFSVFHYDLYRLPSNALEELELLGIRDQLAEKAVLLIEWPDRVANFLKPNIKILIEHLGDARRKIILTTFLE